MDETVGRLDRRITNVPPHIVALLAEIDEAKGGLRAGLRMAPQAALQLRSSVLVTSAGASTRIEGSTLSDAEVERVMRGLAISRLAERDCQEVQGYLEVLNNVFDGYETLPLRESTILSLHNELLKYSSKDERHKGRYKTGENLAGILAPDGKSVARVIFNTSPAWSTPAEMTGLVEWAHLALEHKRFHPLLVIAGFIVEFLKIHPFTDGNGRLSRILTNLLLLRAGYAATLYVSHEQIIERRKDEYYIALRQAQEILGPDGENIIPWLNYFLSVVKEQEVKALSRVASEQLEDMLSPRQLSVFRYLSEDGEAARGEIARATELPGATVNQALGRLLALGKIRRVGRGRATKYVKL